MHTYFDVDGAPCTVTDAYTTVVTREPEWDDASRGRATQLAEHERMTDKQTGLPIKDAFDADALFRVDSTINYADRAISKVREQEAKLHENDEGWSKGRTYYAVRVDPADLPTQDERTAQ